MSFKSNFAIHILMAYIYLASGLVVNILQMLCVPLWYFSFKRTYRRMIGLLNHLNWCLIPCVAQWWSGMEVYLYARPGEFEKLGTESIIAILNHRGQLDWVVSWVVAEYSNILGMAKCIAKNSIRYIPVMGWSFWMAESVFLKRKIEKDKKTLEKGFKALASFKQPYWFLIFCEGTRFTPERHQKSIEFERKNGLKPLKHLLQPKTKGFVLTTQGLRNNVDYIYDAAVCFHGDTEPTLMDMLNGKPCKADFLVRRTPISEVPVDDDECAEYLRDLYQDKDELCEYHKHHDTFPIDGQNPKYSDYERRKIENNMLSFTIAITWAVVLLVPLFYYAYMTIVWGTLFQKGMFTFAVLIVSVVFQVMLKAGKPKGAK
uniref:1-acyl-sn-glycerol-3-phosphate acyltransferase gamma-like n=1 Tax=Phallusia mammillata TaxID=59560 RepID=A0A6F9D6N7_9ASCI|nr:1-acyl-sn-glycerol-3-phosphate acyltransferase gamma-like [Phallusia mammillata]